MKALQKHYIHTDGPTDGHTLSASHSFLLAIITSYYASAAWLPFRAASLIASAVSNELVMIQLLETHCISILSYAIEVIHVADPDTRRKLRVAYNSIFRKVFDYKRSESVTELQHQLGRPTWEELIVKRTEKFQASLSNCDIAKMFLI